MNEATKAAVETAIEGHKHPQDIRVIEHPGYEPFIKLVCDVCPHAETYVKRIPDGV